MPSTWIYVFADSGYERGVKVGRSSSAFAAWDDAPGYSPRPLIYVAGWRIELHQRQDVTRGVAASKVEHSLHEALGNQLVFPRNGREWFDLAPAAAVEQIADVLAAEPSIRNGHGNRTVTNDQFRNPHPRRLDQHRFKIALWFYREHYTDHLKAQFIDDWTTPFETRRRYS